MFFSPFQRYVNVFDVDSFVVRKSMFKNLFIYRFQELEGLKPIKYNLPCI